MIESRRLPLIRSNQKVIRCDILNGVQDGLREEIHMHLL